MIVTEITPMEKGKVKVAFDDAQSFILYKGEVRRFGLKEQEPLSDDVYKQIYYDVVGKRAMKRALYLLEKMDRTEEQLRKKLLEGKYPKDLIDAAIDYVKSYHYIDDERYARTFVRLNQERRSAGRMKMDLMARGVAEDIIDRAMEEENETLPEDLIRKLLEKKHFDPDTASIQETKKMYQFLMRRGFRCEDIMHVLKDTASCHWP